MNKIGLFIFTNDLRLMNNKALEAFSKRCNEIIPIYINDTKNTEHLKRGKHSKWFLYEALKDLNKKLSDCLLYIEDDLCKFISSFVKEQKIEVVGWSRGYTPEQIRRFTKLKKQLTEDCIQPYSYSGNLLIEPWNILKKDAKPYKVFTPFFSSGYKYRKYLLEENFYPRIKCVKVKRLNKLNISDTSRENYLKKYWDVSEQGAKNLLNEFLEKKIVGYKKNRDFPAKEGTSKLSPYLHFGLLSPMYILSKVFSLKNIPSEDAQSFFSEIVWREFSYYLLYHFPYIKTDNFNKKFDNFRWVNSKEFFNKWKNGDTGIPIVDAGINELLTTGYMHNRVRMIVASFLTKNLLIDWRKGKDFFSEYLCDADEASNAASWQWVAGSGVDAAPYFRVFNPVLQAKKFDPEGNYIRKYIPVLSKLPNKYIFEPWLFNSEILDQYGVNLGENYSYPIVDLKDSRKKALYYYEKLI